MNTAEASPLLSLRELGLRYPNGIVALDRLSFDLRAGETVSVLGPSGCGKSTALRLIAGLERPGSGTLVWTGGSAPELGFVFQEPTLMPWATVADNVWLPLRLQGRTRAAAATTIDAALDRVGLTAAANVYPHELSGGMKMRASIARALALRPQLLLMDEPFGALDELTRQKLNDDLLAIRAEQGFAMVFVTHSVYESVYLADRVLLMGPAPGRLREEIRIEPRGPRGEAFRTAAHYGEQCVAVSRALRRAVEGVAVGPD
ncbi:ABC transporter ATP-binding protein [Methylibium sp. Pch-M]|uniref:ABC transporter ATP-binding protein n=1 Tax=Methylibium sp. Pch-M TaxID=2082386 RepID=UPI0010116B89|nr:ABC transporter ATP-binding protein [Methylibium sp. Pch-M]QAZ39181.1 ABC transporter ATP-binding protein [Methylibium sp. Pch-M]